MPDPRRPSEPFDRGALSAELAEATRALDALAEGPARAAGEALEKSIARATQAARAELQSLVKTGEADINRLTRALAEGLAQAAVSRIGGASGVGSSNQVAALIAEAVRKGMRFT